MGLKNNLEKYAPDDKVIVTYVRNNEEKTAELVLGKSE